MGGQSHEAEHSMDADFLSCFNRRLVLPFAKQQPEIRRRGGGIQDPGRVARNSVCMVKGSPCHDEVNVYRFSSVAGRPNAFSVTASKVVDGKEIVMGSGEWTYDPGNHLVESKAPAIRLTIAGDKMEGALSLADGTVYRRVHLKKES
jgi:hypothetical protein